MINIKFFVLLIVGFSCFGFPNDDRITLENQNIIENQTQLIHQIEDHFDSLRIEMSR